MSPNNLPARSAHFVALVARQPDNELFRFSLAQALAEEGRGAEAVPHFEFCRQKKADWMRPRIRLGKLLVQLARRAEAKPVLEQHCISPSNSSTKIPNASCG